MRQPGQRRVDQAVYVDALHLAGQALAVQSVGTGDHYAVDIAIIRPNDDERVRRQPRMCGDHDRIQCAFPIVRKIARNCKSL